MRIFKVLYLYFTNSDFRYYVDYAVSIHNNDEVLDTAREQYNKMLQLLSTRIDQCYFILDEVKKSNIDDKIKDKIVSIVNEMTNGMKDWYRDFDNVVNSNKK